MPRRRTDESAVAESDSFLDIVANIVGILIILIVIVGVRVGQSTVATVPPSDVVQTEPAKPPPVLAPRPVFVDAPAPPAPEPIPVDPQLLTAIETAHSEVKQLRHELTVAAGQRSNLTASVSQAQQAFQQLTTDQTEVKQRLEEIDTTRENIAAKLREAKETEKNLREQISDVPAENVTVFKHELNPIGRSVRGEELHFRISEGRVSHVPLDDFVERLKPRIEEQKEWVARHNRYEGRIGPFDGYSMEYVLERESLGLADELRLGSRVMRISVTGWKMVPEKTLVTESVEQALHANSRFQQTLRLAERRATLTFWVYPDSFTAYRRLQEFAHEEGFDVAARPLPAGVPIAGSPDGSRSTSQ